MESHHTGVESFLQRALRNPIVRYLYSDLGRYHFFVDNMPIDDVLTLEPEQIHRILKIAHGGSFSAKLQPSVESAALLKELNMDYTRAMNRIIFDRYRGGS